MKHITEKLSNEIIFKAVKDSFKKLNPKVQIKNIVMFIVYIGAIIITILWILSFFIKSSESSAYIFVVSLILWTTSLFSNFAESLSEGKSHAQSQYLKSLKKGSTVFKIEIPSLDSKGEFVNSNDLKFGDLILVQTGEQIYKDGEVILGAAFVDESSITGESTPIKKDNSEERSSVTGGSKVISDYIIVKITEKPGVSFLDNMISMIESSNRKKLLMK